MCLLWFTINTTKRNVLDEETLLTIVLLTTKLKNVQPSAKISGLGQLAVSAVTTIMIFLLHRYLNGTI